MQLRMQRSKSSTGNARTSSLGCEEENETLKEEAWGPDVLVCIGARRASKAQEEQEEADEKKKTLMEKHSELAVPAPVARIPLLSSLLTL